MKHLVFILFLATGWAQIPAGNVCNGGYFSGNQQCLSGGRVYRVVVPANLPVNAPIIVALHPSQPANIYAANGMMSTTGWDYASAAAGGFIAIFPEASIDANGKKNWVIDFDTAPPRVDDVAFIRSLIVKYSKLYGTDPKRNYVAGFSMGADMAHKMARQASDLIAAAASVEGHLWTLPSGMPLPHFAPIQPVSVLIICGARDSILPCKGGPNTSNTVTVPDSNWDFYFWVHIDHLIDDIAVKPIIANNVMVLTHKIASGPYTVEFYGLPYGGHNWYRTSMTDKTNFPASYQPDVAALFSGMTTSDLVLRFFLAHPKP